MKDFLPKALIDDVTRAGYLPEIVITSMAIACAGEEVRHHIVLPETSVNHHGVQRHLTVVALTDTRLITGHVDDFDGETDQAHVATARTESVRLGDVRNISISHVYAEPNQVTRQHVPNELAVSIAWGNARRSEIEPADCGNSECDADHGYTSLSGGDDLTLTANWAQDGGDKVMELIDFAGILSTLTIVV
ncbi:phosphodiesterase [Micrococcales bacterium 31B]|nr:phosphodiesterase [Micrococcales bacterium 31B]